jgi:alpha-ribazole phosphatase
MRLFLIRHPRPQVASGVCYGQSDLPIADGELTRVLGALAGRLPAEAPVLSSPLQRCRQLAEALAPGRVGCDARLMEMNFGAWELTRWTDIARVDIDAWAADPAGFRPGGAESLTEMAERIAAFAAELTAGGGDAAVLVCHAGSMRLLRALTRGLAPADAAREAAATPNAIGYGTLEVLDFPQEET